MKIAVTGDVQAHNHQAYSRHSGGVNSRLVTACDCIRFAADQAQGGWLIVNGDLFHDQKSIAIDVWHSVLLSVEYAASVCKGVLVSAGNHDQFLKNGMITSIRHLRHIDGVEVVEDHGVFSFLRGFGVFVHAHTEDHDAFRRRVKEWARQSDFDPSHKLLIAHQGIRGAILPGGHLSESDLTVDDLCPDAFAQVLLGDYHRPQSLADNVHYVGSPYQIDWGEAGDAKRILVFDTSTGKLESIPTNTPEFKAVTLEAWQTKHKDDTFNFFKVVLSPDEQPVEAPPNVRFDWKDEVELVPSPQIQGDFSIEEAVTAWLTDAGHEGLVRKAIDRLHAV